MSWQPITQRPPSPGTYPVRLFTGIERAAYWTGATWIGSDTGKQAERRRGQRQLLKLLRQWDDGQPDPCSD